MYRLWSLSPSSLFHQLWTFPSPCTAFSQSLSVNSFRWRIWGERAGNASHFRLDHVTRNALAARNNDAQGRGNWELRRGLQITQTTSKTVQWGKPRRWSTSSSVVTSLITTYHKYHWPQAHKRDPSLEAASGPIVYWRPTPDFTVNTLRTTTVVISTTLDYPYQRTKRMKCSPQTHANSEERIHQQLNKQSKWSFLLFYQKTMTTHTNEASLSDATLFHTLNNLVLLFWNLSVICFIGLQWKQQIYLVFQKISLDLRAPVYPKQDGGPNRLSKRINNLAK